MQELEEVFREIIFVFSYLFKKDGNKFFLKESFCLVLNYYCLYFKDVILEV